MASQTRPRARSSVDHLFDLVESLEEDQLQSFLAELNSTPDTNIDVSSGVAYFEDHRRRTTSGALTQHLRPTPSFLNAPPEPADWPRQKPRPVSGSQWRQSMRIVSAPYAKHVGAGAGAGGGVNEPVSPPLTASPPASPPLGKRSLTAPVMMMMGSENKNNNKIDVRVDTRQVEEPSPVSPPRHLLDGGREDDDDESDARPAFGAFSFRGLDGARDDKYDAAHLVHDDYSSSSSSAAADDHQESAQQSSRPVSPAQRLVTMTTAAPADSITPPPELAEPQEQLPQQPQQQQQQLPEFSRMATMPLSLHLHHTPLSFDEGPARPRTSMGLAPRAFRRVSRPVFLDPAEGAEELAGRLSAFLFGGAAVGVQQQQRGFMGRPREREEEERNAVEEMLKEPGAPRGRAVFGKGEREGVPVSGIFEVLTEG